MQSTFDHLDEAQQRRIYDTLTPAISELQPAQIICWGARYTEAVRWSSFSKLSKTRSQLTIDLLVVVKQKDDRLRSIVADAFTKLSAADLQFTCLVHSIPAIHKALDSGNPFFSTVFAHGIELYRCASKPLREVSTNILLEAQVSPGIRQLNLAKGFYQSALDAASRGRHDLAIFLLHQSVELSCSALIRLRLGYNPTTHSISKLFVLIDNITPDISKIFPRSTSEEISLFEILQHAYSEVRYNDDYPSSPDSFQALMKRVSDLQHQVNKFCGQNPFESERPSASH